MARFWSTGEFPNVLSGHHLFVINILRPLLVLAAVFSLVLVSIANPLSAKVSSASSDDFRSSVGTDFWLTFDMNAFNGQIKELFTPQIILSAVRDSTVVITWPDETTQTVSVAAGTVEVVNASSKIYTPEAFNIYVFNGDNSNNGIRKTGVKVESDWPISVYTTNLKTSSSGASVAYPTSFLDTRYRLIGVDDVIASTSDTACDKQTRYSILATEDGTTVTVTPSADYEVLGTQSTSVFTVSLDAGESYTVGSTVCQFAVFSGTLVEADKKIVVKTSGNIRTISPEAKAGDFVTEFLPPVSTWGKSFILPTNDELAYDPSKFYIVTDEATTININGGANVNLAAGATATVTGTNSSPFADVLVADKPILVMKVFGGVDYNDTTAFPLASDRVDGDNEIVMITPNEQFLNDFIFTTPGMSSQFRHHRITVVAKTSDISNIELDGSSIDANAFSQVGSSDFSVARLPLTEGSHRLKSTAGFAVYVYGYGERDSYAYSAGTGLVNTIANPGGTADTGFKSLELLSGLISDSPTSSSPAPYAGPLVTSVGDSGVAGAFQTFSGQTVRVNGERLAGVTKVFVDGLEAALVSTANDHFFMVLPNGITDGVHDLVIQSNLGNLRYLDGLSINSSLQVSMNADNSCKGQPTTVWTQRISDTQAKAYVKCPEAGKKYRILQQVSGAGSYQSVFVRTISNELDASQVFNENGRYIVRTIELEDINRIRIRIDDLEVWKVRYNR